MPDPKKTGIVVSSIFVVALTSLFLWWHAIIADITSLAYGKGTLASNHWPLTKAVLTFVGRYVFFRERNQTPPAQFIAEFITVFALPCAVLVALHFVAVPPELVKGASWRPERLWVNVLRAVYVISFVVGETALVLAILSFDQLVDNTRTARQRQFHEHIAFAQSLADAEHTGPVMPSPYRGRRDPSKCLVFWAGETTDKSGNSNIVWVGFLDARDEHHPKASAEVETLIVVHEDPLLVNSAVYENGTRVNCYQYRYRIIVAAARSHEIWAAADFTGGQPADPPFDLMSSPGLRSLWGHNVPRETLEGYILDVLKLTDVERGFLQKN